MRREAFRIEWDAPEYEHKERSSDWFWAVGIIVVSISIVSIIFGNIIFAILILLCAFTLTLFINRPPDEVHVIIDEKGITREKVRYPYSTLQSFWIDEEHPHKKIILRSQKMFMPLIVIPISDDTDPERIEKILLEFIPQEFHALPWAERFLEYLGF